MQKIITYFWFENAAEKAANFYTSLFKDSSIEKIARYGKGSPGPEGTAMTVAFELAGQKFLALNGGPGFKFTPAISLLITCEDQKEVDHFWERLSEGGEKGQCGWLTDKFGISWQVVPSILPVLLTDQDPVKVERVTQAMLKMTKLDIAELEKASRA